MGLGWMQKDEQGGMWMWEVDQGKVGSAGIICSFLRYIFCWFYSSPINQQMNSRRVWTEEEDKVISELVKQQGVKNWASIASLLSKRLRAKPRSGKQCRERWHNHLNPTIEKKGWSSEEEQKLFELHKSHGNKWTVIAEHLPGRTDNAIKNYFYSSIRRSLRRMGKFVGSKNSTEQMKKIKPSTLSKIFAAGSELNPSEGSKEQLQLINYIKQNCESVRDEIIQFTNYKPTRNDKANSSEQNRFQKVINKMVHINQVYEKIKGEDKKRRYEEQMFQKDYNKLMHSSDSEEPSEDSDSQTLHKPTPSRSTMRINEEFPFSSREKEAQAATNVKGDSSSQLMPTVIIKPQANLEIQQQEGQFQNPEFLIEIKEDYVPVNLRSPGYFFNTPSKNPFIVFSSPSTPKSMETCFSSIQVLGVLHNNAIDQFQISIQKQIQNNLSGNQRKVASISTIGSPGSAFRNCR